MSGSREESIDAGGTPARRGLGRDLAALTLVAACGLASATACLGPAGDAGGTKQAIASTATPESPPTPEPTTIVEPVRDSADGEIRVATLAGELRGYRDGSGFDARLAGPTGIALDGAGNLVVSDQGNQRIRKITASGIVTTFAGSGTVGYLDGSPASARFSAPTDLVVDASGTVYVCEVGNHVIRRIASDGTVSTVAGNGTNGYQDGASATATFSRPRGIALDGLGNLFVAEVGNHRIRKVAPDRTVTTLAGAGGPGHGDGPLGAARFARPRGEIWEASGSLLVADGNNDAIRRVIPDGGVTTLTGAIGRGFADGPASSAKWNSPVGLAAGSGGVIYVCENGGNRIRRIGADGTVTTIAGTGTKGGSDGPAAKATFDTPLGIAYDAARRRLYVADHHNHRIRVISPVQ